jgi:hypothetical protein
LALTFGSCPRAFRYALLARVCLSPLRASPLLS